MTISKSFSVTNEDIKSSRLARDMLDCIRPFAGTVFIEKENRKIRANTLLNILSLGIEYGDELKFSCISDNNQAIDELFSKMKVLIA